MKTSLAIIPEPELEFAGGNRHEDIRFGLMNFGPLLEPTHPRLINVGIVGTASTIEQLRGWVERCSLGIGAKRSSHYNLFPHFPGFGSGSCFGIECSFPDAFLGQVSEKTLLMAMQSSPNKAIADAVDVFLAELNRLDEGNSRPHVVLCAIPPVLLASATGEDTTSASEPILNFRSLLKAKAMHLRFPIQIVQPATFHLGGKRSVVGARTGTYEDREVQDEASRAWNFFVALIYKAGIAPWRIARESHGFDTCFVGISFYHTLESDRIMTSMAQVFNERGEGMIVRGDPVHLSKDDPQPHLAQEDARKLVRHALTKYKDEHRHLPARVVIHKTSSFSDSEQSGCLLATKELDVDLVDLISIAKSSIRVFREGDYPPLRGTLVSLDVENHLLYSRGSSRFYQTYTGLYVPRPLSIRLARCEQGPLQLAREIIALTKLNWNSTQIDGSLPITIRAARRVGDILKYVPDSEKPRAHYSYYM